MAPFFPSQVAAAGRARPSIAHPPRPSSGEQRHWKQGEVIVFDDSFEHEVWHNGTRSVLSSSSCCVVLFVGVTSCAARESS
jgi:hypothetical protein